MTRTGVLVRTRILIACFLFFYSPWRARSDGGMGPRGSPAFVDFVVAALPLGWGGLAIRHNK